MARKRRLNSCAKGKRLERELAAIFRAAGFPGTQRTIQGRGGAEAPDLSGLPIRVEVKGGSARYVDPVGALEQCERDGAAAKDPRVPVAITRIDRGRWVVTIRAARLFELAGLYAGPTPHPIDREPVSMSLPALVALIAPRSDPTLLVNVFRDP